MSVQWTVVLIGFIENSCSCFINASAMSSEYRKYYGSKVVRGTALNQQKLFYKHEYYSLAYTFICG